MPLSTNHISQQEKERYNTYLELIKDGDRSLFLGEILRASYERNPEDTALIFDDTHMTYHDLYGRAVAFSKVLSEKGVVQDDRVLLFFENSLEFYVAYFAILQLGAVVAPLNVFLTQSELEHIIKDADPKAIVVSNKLLPLVEAVEKRPIVIQQDAIDMATPVPEKIEEVAIPHKDADALAVLLYTSGTTGFPKGVMLSSNNALINTVQGMARIDFPQQARVFCVLPLFHSFAQNTCVWASILRGCTVIVVPKIDRRYILTALTKYQPDIFLGVPALYGLLCLLKTAPLDGIQLFVSGGDALPDKIRAAFGLVYGRKICNGYGLTETSPLIAFDSDDVIEPTNTVGRPVIDLEISLRDEKGAEIKQGIVGRLWVRGPNVMMGYYNEPEKTSEVLKDGWLDTGDLAYQDRCGKLVMSGRMKDLIIHKGINIYPQEIENVLLTHSNVLRAAVIGKEDESSGEVPIAFVQLRAENDTTKKEVRDLCVKNLAAYKVPREIYCQVEDLPLTATSKVDKKKLRKQLK